MSEKIPNKTKKPKKPRANCTYKGVERAVLDAFREEYKSEVDGKARRQIYTTKVLPAIFNFWTDNGTRGLSEKERAERIRVSLLKNTTMDING